MFASNLLVNFVLHVELRAATHDALRVGVSKFGRRGTEALASAINLHTLNLLRLDEPDCCRLIRDYLIHFYSSTLLLVPYYTNHTCVGISTVLTSIRLAESVMCRFTLCTA